MYRTFIVICLGVLLPGGLWADPPVAQYLFPAGGQRGTTVQFHVGGLYLNQECALAILGEGVTAPATIKRTTAPWFEGSLLPLPESQRQEDYPRAMAATATIAPTARGERLVILRTPQGITTPLKFIIGEHPEIVEDEKDGEPYPVPVPTPVTVNGRIYPREDRDIYTVVLKKGDVLSCLVDAERFGSPLDPLLEVRDPDGRRLAEMLPTAGRDPRIRIQAQQDGVHQVHITDAKMDGGPAFVYRLTLTTAPVIDHVYPLGGQRGKSVVVETSGSEGNARRTLQVPAKGQPTFAFPFDVDELPEWLAATEPTTRNTLAVPGIANGRIATPGAVQQWHFHAKKGESLAFELRAAQLGSSLLGVLTITDSTGKELAKAEPAATLDPTLLFTVPADGGYTIAVQDRFRKRGGPGFAYRLRVTHPENGFTLSFATPTVTVLRGSKVPVKITAKRTGAFTGPIQLYVAGLTPGVTVPSNLVIPAGQTTADITLSAETTATLTDTLLRVRGEALVPLLPLTAMPTVMTKPAISTDGAFEHLHVAVAIPTPFKIVGSYELKLIPRGTVHTRKYRIERNGYTGPIEIDLADRQARHLQGVTGPVLQIPGDQSEFEYPITLPPWMETGRTCRVCVMGTATVRDASGKDYVVSYSSREQNDQIIAVVEPERLGISIDQQTLRAEPGMTVTVPFAIQRGQKLHGDATVNVQLPAEMKGVVVPAVVVEAKQNHGQLKFTFDARVPLTTRTTITVRAVVIEQGRPVTAEKQLELLPVR